MLIQRRGANAVDNGDILAFPEVNRGRREQFGVQGEEFVGVGVGPEGEARGAANELKGVLEGIYDVYTTKTVLFSAQSGHFRVTGRN